MDGLAFQGCQWIVQGHTKGRGRVPVSRSESTTHLSRCGSDTYRSPSPAPLDASRPHAPLGSTHPPSANMRSLFYSLLSLATIASTLAVETSTGATPSKAAASDDWEEKAPDTIFNGQTVPPMIELTKDTLDKEIAKGHWLVEFYSPYCGHCKQFKPIYQTAYEFYYTSKPILSQDDSDADSLNSFTRYYDFKFAKVDCVAFADLCNAHNIGSYPTLIYYVDGKEVQIEKGSRDIKALSTWIESLLKTIRPGSRKEGGPKLPAPGANSVKTGLDTEEASKGEKKDNRKEAVKQSASKPAGATTPTQSAKAKPAKAKPTSNANPSGVVEALTAEKFQKVVVNTLDPWFIKFYAPWCHHCQALAPVWVNLARQMRGKLNIGEVNCDIEKKLCKEAGVKGYPTMQFYRGGERIEYQGMRGLGDLMDYAEKAMVVGEGVPDVNAEEFEKLEKTEEVIFVYFYDVATTSEDFQALERLPLSLVGRARLVKTNDKALCDRFKISTWPRLMVSRDGKPSYYPPMTPKEMRDTRQTLNWMKTVWLPLVPELTSSNAKDIMEGKFVVLGILSRDRSDEFILSKREMKSAALEWIDKQETAYQLERQELRDAKQLRIEEAEDKDDHRALANAKSIRINMDEIERAQVTFAWVDGVFWERWIRQTYGIDVKEGERVIINDEANHRYWDTTISGEPIRPSRTSIMETLGKVTVNPPKITPKSTTGRFMGAILTTRHFCGHHPFIALGMFVGFFTAAVLFGKSRRRRSFGNTGAYFQLNEKDGLLGGNGNHGGAKHD
ncbi:similar to disulfide isomerase [Plenodomus lingam JN3]|uniref:Similar to disulfide isomerase n=1 Tax=Leptosphaeria maculans (strain JN3 / isolate v23.1.3 / race Av1-4-5-6-7-8) TaxID=985895 RepID=E4ZI85_LEPMJ|nr:similar to disulfide isomerase [Plenodomus lingam JN3]CBX90746.1 similar to disulfide isomerase [Plenodomus lingam JN3]